MTSCMHRLIKAQLTDAVIGWRARQQHEEQQLRRIVSLHQAALQQMICASVRLSSQYTTLLVTQWNHRWRGAADNHKQQTATQRLDKALINSRAEAEQRQMRRMRRIALDRMDASLRHIFKGSVQYGYLVQWRRGLQQSIEQQQRREQLARQQIDSLLKAQVIRAALDRRWIAGLLQLWHLQHCSSSRELLECRCVSLEEQLLLMEVGMTAEMQQQV